MQTTKVTTKGRITIPVEFRKKLGLKQGDKIEFDLLSTAIVVRKVR